MSHNIAVDLSQLTETATAAAATAAPNNSHGRHLHGDEHEVVGGNSNNINGDRNLSVTLLNGDGDTCDGGGDDGPIATGPAPVVTIPNATTPTPLASKHTAPTAVVVIPATATTTTTTAAGGGGGDGAPGGNTNNSGGHAVAPVGRGCSNEDEDGSNDECTTPLGQMPGAVEAASASVPAAVAASAADGDLENVSPPPELRRWSPQTPPLNRKSPRSHPPAALSHAVGGDGGGGEGEQDDDDDKEAVATTEAADNSVDDDEEEEEEEEPTEDVEIILRHSRLLRPPSVPRAPTDMSDGGGSGAAVSPGNGGSNSNNRHDDDDEDEDGDGDGEENSNRNTINSIGGGEGDRAMGAAAPTPPPPPREGPAAAASSSSLMLPTGPIGVEVGSGGSGGGGGGEARMTSSIAAAAAAAATFSSASDVGPTLHVDPTTTAAVYSNGDRKGSRGRNNALYSSLAAGTHGTRNQQHQHHNGADGIIANNSISIDNSINITVNHSDSDASPQPAAAAAAAPSSPPWGSPEVFALIADYAGSRALCQLMRVNTAFYAAATSDAIWYALMTERLNLLPLVTEAGVTSGYHRFFLDEVITTRALQGHYTFNAAVSPAAAAAASSQSSFSLGQLGGGFGSGGGASDVFTIEAVSLLMSSATFGQTNHPIGRVQLLIRYKGDTMEVLQGSCRFSVHRRCFSFCCNAFSAPVRGPVFTVTVALVGKPWPNESPQHFTGHRRGLRLIMAPMLLEGRICGSQVTETDVIAVSKAAAAPTAAAAVGGTPFSSPSSTPASAMAARMHAGPKSITITPIITS